MDDERLKRVDSFIRGVRDLSTLPEVIKKIIELTSDPNISIAKVEEAISTDPVISTRLLRIVNSAYYSFFREITSIRQAIVVLGLDATKNLVYGTSIITAFGRHSKIERFPFEGFWQFSVATGNISRTLSSLLDYHFYQEAFLAGLVHDIGKIVLASYRPLLFEEAIHNAYEHGVPLREAEEAVLGFNHSEVGQRLAVRWRLPRLLEEVIAFNENPRIASDYGEVTCVVRLAALLCREHGIGISGEPEKAIEMRSDEAWQMLSERNHLLDTLDFERFTASLDEEVEKVESFVNAMFAT
ncbi:MAG TPA: HDOD domain-containing protein [Acidobacteriota bacterium]|nr:HDOD domain-containing protein [Acidobacteriota bacterium]